MNGKTKGSSRRRTQTQSHKPRRHPDIELASIAVKAGIVTEDAAKQALHQVKKRAKEGKPRISFIRILLTHKLIDPAFLPRLAEETERHTYICDNCERRIVLAPSRNRSSVCPRCGQMVRTIEADTPSRMLLDTTKTHELDVPGLAQIVRSRRSAFGRYQIEAELGRGAMGVVYKARHVELKKDIALKVLLAGVGASNSHVARFRREAAAVGRLNHPNIVRVFDFGVEDDLHFLAMDLVPGGESMHTALKKEDRLGLKERLRIVEKVARAIQHAHEEGVIHRDLKPANILLTPEGEPMVADFGLAKDFTEEDELTQPEARVGTPLFLAPELIHRGSANVDARADVWALGVMLFLSVTGRYPFRCKTVMELYVQILQEDPDWDGSRSRRLVSSGDELATRRLQQPFYPGADEFPHDLELVCRKALSKQPADRYQTASDFAEEIARFLNGEAVRVRAPSLTEKMRSVTRGRQAKSTLLIAVMVLVVAGLAGFLILERSRAEALAVANQQLKRAQDAWAPAVDSRSAYTRRGYERSLKLLDFVLTEQPDHPLTRYYHGQCLLALFRDSEAEGDFRSAMAKAEGAVRVRSSHALALLYLFQNLPNEALEASEPTFEDNSFDDGRLERALLRARILIARDRSDDLARAEAELKGLEAAEASLLLGTIEWRRNAYPRALAKMEEALSSRPDLREAQLAREVIALRLKRGQREETLRRIAQIEDSFTREGSLDRRSRYYFNEAGEFAAAKDWEKTIQACDRALSLAYWFVKARHRRARALRALNRIPEALDAYSEAVRLNPRSNRKALENEFFELLDLACDVSALDKVSGVLREFDLWKGEKTKPRNLEYLGMLRFSANQLEDARELFSEAYDKTGDSLISLLFLSEIDEILSAPKRAESRERWRKARANPENADKLTELYARLARAYLLRRSPNRGLDAHTEALDTLARSEDRDRWEARLHGIRAGLSALRMEASEQERARFESELRAAVEGEEPGISSYELSTISAFAAVRDTPVFQELLLRLRERERLEAP